jgi:hypothetical protein
MEEIDFEKAIDGPLFMRCPYFHLGIRCLHVNSDGLCEAYGMYASLGRVARIKKTGKCNWYLEPLPGGLSK